MRLQRAFSAFSVALLSACASGGGGGSDVVVGGSPTQTASTTPKAPAGAAAIAPYGGWNFLSWEWWDLDPGFPVVMKGNAVEATYSANAAKTITGAGTVTTGAAEVAVVVIDPPGASAIGFTTSKTALDIKKQIQGEAFDKLASNSIYTVANTQANGPYVIFVNPITLQHLVRPLFEYQSFGTWMSSPSAGTLNTGAMSFGAPTVASAVPTTGSASFDGLAAGHYVDSDGALYIVTANAAGSVDFAAHTIALSTSNSMTAPNISASGSANGNLDLSATMNYAAGGNEFSGQATSAGGGVGNAKMTGTASGVFYGDVAPSLGLPAASEIGGTFSLSGGGTTSYVGAYGAKRN